MTDIMVENIASVYLYKTDRSSWKSAPSPRQHYCLAYQVTGHYDHKFSHGKLTVKTDTLFFINKDEEYSVIRKTQGEAICVTFCGETDLKSMVIDCSSEPKFLNLFRKLYQCRPLQIKSNYYRALSVLYEIISLMESKTEQRYLTNESKTRLALAHKYIIENYMEEINITNLANEHNMSVKHFRNLFKEIYGETPKQYIINMKLSNAATLLAQGNLNVQEIAEISGFSDVYYFSKLFKKKFSCSPKRFNK